MNNNNSIIRKILGKKDLSEQIACHPTSTSDYVRKIGEASHKLIESQEVTNTITPEIPKTNEVKTEETSTSVTEVSVTETINPETPKTDEVKTEETSTSVTEVPVITETVNPGETTTSVTEVPKVDETPKVDEVKTEVPVITETVNPEVPKTDEIPSTTEESKEEELKPVTEDAKLNEEDARMEKSLEEKFKDMDKIKVVNNFDLTSDEFDTIFDKFVDANRGKSVGDSILNALTNHAIPRFTLKACIRATLIHKKEHGHFPVDFFKKPFAKIKAIIEPLYFHKDEHDGAPTSSFNTSFEMEPLSFILKTEKTTKEDMAKGASDKFLFLREDNYFYPNGIFIAFCNLLVKKLDGGNKVATNESKVNELTYDVNGQKVRYGSNKHLRNVYTLYDPDHYDTRPLKMYNEAIVALREAIEEVGADKINNAVLYDNGEDYIIALPGAEEVQNENAKLVGRVIVTEDNNIYLEESSVAKSEYIIRAESMDKILSLVPSDKLDGADLYKDVKTKEFIVLLPVDIEQFFSEDEVEFVGIIYVDDDGKAYVEDGDDKKDNAEIGKVEDEDEDMDFDEKNYEGGEDEEVNETVYKKVKVAKGNKIIVKKKVVGHATGLSSKQKSAMKKNIKKAQKASRKAVAVRKRIKSLKTHNKKLNNSVENTVKTPINENKEAMAFLKQTLTEMKAPEYLFTWLDEGKVNIVERWVGLNS